MASATHPDILEVTCADGHISYYHKRDVCGPAGIVWRVANPAQSGAGDTLLLPCKHDGCTRRTLRVVDCRGHR